MPKQLTLDEPTQLAMHFDDWPTPTSTRSSTLSSSSRVVAPVDGDKNDERPSADARSRRKRPLDALVDEVGDCYACGMPAFDLGTGGRRECCDCGRGLCDPIAGCDCGPAMLQPRGPMCWGCYHEDNDG